MKSIFAALALTLLSSPAFAGTGISYSNDALGFTLNFGSMTDEGAICDSSDNCLTIVPIKDLGKNKTLYREAKGKCDIVIEQFEKNFADGTTKNDFMLSLGAQVVKVVKGEDRCTLFQESMKQQRSVTGIYQ
jgi:hypothetical protein